MTASKNAEPKRPGVFAFEEETHHMMKEQSKKQGPDVFHRPMTDPQGSYTGVPENPNEKPVQDADDL